MKREAFNDELEKKPHKSEKGSNKFDKHKKNLYNMLLDDDYEYDLYDKRYRSSYKNNNTKQR